VDKRSEEAIECLVADWPPLTEETKARLKDLLSPGRGAPMTKDEWIQRELAEMSARSEDWKAETRRQWGTSGASGSSRKSRCQALMKPLSAITQAGAAGTSWRSFRSRPRSS
jgi:hypothetical protein